MMAYLSMMAPRLVELRRVLKPSGSLYLHCDPTASHYLKLLLDATFGTARFRTEIVWKRTSAHSDTKQGRKQHGRIHDVLLFYTKADEWSWHPVYTEYEPEYVDAFYKFEESSTGRRYRKGDLTAARPGGDTSYQWRVKRSSGKEWEADLGDEWKSPVPGWEYRGVPPYRGRYWAYSKKNMRKFASEGRLVDSRSGMPNYKRYLDEMPGVPLQDMWTDIRPAHGAERLSYPTQKPIALLERIIRASSDKGATVLDPFCGCGTATAAAQKLGRRWIGIDITHLAIALVRYRLRDSFRDDCKFDVIGEPVSLPDARVLAKQDPYQFQWWALGLLGARPVEQKKGADRGIDGRIYFHDEGRGGKTKQIIFSVKAGRVTVSHIRDLVGVIQREKAQIGVFLSLNPPTGPMRREAASAGFYKSHWGQHPCIQLLTIEDVLDRGKTVDYPPPQQT